MSGIPLRDATRPAPKAKYIMVNHAGASPVRLEWDRLELHALSLPASTIPACGMDATTATKFEVMERHHWTYAGNDQLELEIKK